MTLQIYYSVLCKDRGVGGKDHRNFVQLLWNEGDSNDSLSSGSPGHQYRCMQESCSSKDEDNPVSYLYEKNKCVLVL